MPEPQAGSFGLFSIHMLRRFLAIFLPISLVLGGVVAVLYYQDLAGERALHEQAGEHLVALHTSLITRELKGVESDLLYLADQAVLRDFLSGGKPVRQALQEEYVLFSRQKEIYDQIRYLNVQGQEIIRVNYHNGLPSAVADSELQSKAARYYFTQALLLPRGEVFTSHFDLNVEHDAIEQPLKPAIRFATPVFDRQGEKRGVLVLNYLGASLIRKLEEVSVNFPGTAYLLNRESFYLHGRQVTDEWGFMLGHQRTFARDFPEEWGTLADKDEGQLLTANGLFTFRTITSRSPLARSHSTGSGSIHQDPDTSDPQLKIVAHVPPDKLTAHTRRTFKRILSLYAAALALVLGLAAYLAHAGALRRQQEGRLAASEARLRLLSMRLLTAQEDERRRLSRDLHDELGQLVTAVTLDLDRAVQAADAEKKNELLGRGLQGAACVLERLHDISARIRPSILDDLGLKDAVQSYLSDYEQRTGIVTRGELSLDRVQLPALLSENIYRILQEALTNVAKHAQAAEVRVQLWADAHQVVLSVRDTGIGFERGAVDSTRLGLLGMRERAELLQGTFALHSEVGQGTEIRVTLPLPS
jgi:signal transduction histidine kinase